MNLRSNIIINGYSIGILCIIYFFSIRYNDEKTLQNRLYKLMLKFTMFSLVFDILSRFDGKTDTIYPVLNHIGNFSVFLLNTVLSSIWLLYVHNQIFLDDKKTKRLLYRILLINGLNLALLLFSLLTGWYYWIDSANIYHRGPLFGVAAFLTFILIAVAGFFTLNNKSKMDQKQYYSLLLFPVPPFICIILQLIFYGYSMVLNGIVFSLLIVFLTIQNNNIYTDFLTGLYNRKKLEKYLEQRVSSRKRNSSFSAIMIDLDDFKFINDNYGHDAGDSALHACAKLIKSCLKLNDFIARFGGDEFFVILNLDDEIKLEETVTRIKRHIDNYNQTSNLPYKLSCSMGYGIFNPNSDSNMADFLKTLDSLMYENKLQNKKNQKRADTLSY